MVPREFPDSVLCSHSCKPDKISLNSKGFCHRALAEDHSIEIIKQTCDVIQTARLESQIPQ